MFAVQISTICYRVKNAKSGAREPQAPPPQMEPTWNPFVFLENVILQYFRSFGLDLGVPGKAEKKQCRRRDINEQQQEWDEERGECTGPK